MKISSFITSVFTHLNQFRSLFCNLSAVLLLSGCVALSKSDIPGLDKSVLAPGDDAFEVKPVPVSDVLMALRCQMAEAFVDIYHRRKEQKKHPFVKLFNLKQGTGTFSGVTKVVHANDLSISAVIPITGLPSSTITPDLSGDRSGTNSNTISRSFSFSPNVLVEEIGKLGYFKRDENLIPVRSPENKNDLCEKLNEKNIQAGDFLKNKILAEYEAAIKFPFDDTLPGKFSNAQIKEMAKKESENLRKGARLADGTWRKFSESDIQFEKRKQNNFNNAKTKLECDNRFRHDKPRLVKPVMAITKIEIESKFIVTQGFDGGANTTVTLGNPRLTSLKPVLSADYDKTNTHTIKITLPIGTASNVNDKKLIYCDIGNSGGKLICIEKPFSEDAKIDLLAKLEKQERLINSEGKCVDQENLNKLKKDIETSKKSRDQRSAFLARDGIDQNGLRAIMPLSKPKQPGADGKTGESKIKPTASEKLKVALDEKRKVLKRKFKDYLEYLRERKTVPSSKIDRLGTSFKLKIERYSANSIERLSKRLDELKEIGN